MDRLNGLVLNGGQSRRMGIDKGLLSYHGIPQREFVFNLLRVFCNDVFLSCKSTDSIPAELNPLPDEFDMDSPLNGIMTAFLRDAESAWITLPVDMPFVDDNVVRHLLTARDNSYDATCFYDSEGSDPEPMICIWESRCAPLLKEFYSNGNISPRKFLKSHRVKLVESPSPQVHLNVNTPEEMEAFKQANGNYFP
jgi:molybdopterin-guanine dinucleotide biosynthesis protein A